jgi:hypothetical protein
VAGTVLASVPVNSEAGSYLTFAFPIILFCAIGAALYIVLFGRPHPRVPARRIAVANVAHAGPPDPDAAQRAAVAGGLPLAEGAGSAESGAEAAGAVSAAPAEADPDAPAGPDGVAPADDTEASD